MNPVGSDLFLTANRAPTWLAPDGTALALKNFNRQNKPGDLLTVRAGE